MVKNYQIWRVFIYRQDLVSVTRKFLTCRLTELFAKMGQNDIKPACKTGKKYFDKITLKYSKG